MAAAYVRHGIIHILTGYDHLLFVTALLLAVTSLWDLVKVISAFTLAHTITLAMATLDVFRLPEGLVEPLIAASIVFVAAQNVLRPDRSRGKGRLLVAFLFGLFHGLGFAGGLLDAMSGMHAAGATTAIAAFSAGVEIGHQAVVLPTFGGLCLLRRANAGATDRERLLRRYGSAVIALIGVFYLGAALRQAGVKCPGAGGDMASVTAGGFERELPRVAAVSTQRSGVEPVGFAIIRGTSFSPNRLSGNHLL
jgi:hypothetical protein